MDRPETSIEFVKSGWRRPNGQPPPRGVSRRATVLRVAATVLGGYWTLGFAGSLAMGQEEPTAAEVALEQKVKAAYLYNFGRYVQWPAEAFGQPQMPLKIGLYGEASFGAYLEKNARSRTLAGRSVAVVYCGDLQSCLEHRLHILFVPSTVSEAEEQALLSAHRERPILLVGESEGFADRGGTINFYLDKEKVRFEINLQAARRTGLKPSAKLLQSARLVEPKPTAQPGGQSSTGRLPFFRR